MIKLAVFDLDGTLAPIGKPIPEDCVRLLKKIEQSGVRIVISSGKPVYYLIGMFRQAGLADAVFIGENGGSIAFGVSLPPEFLDGIKPDNNFFITKNKIMKDVECVAGDKIWLQPNEVMLTLFFKDGDTRNLLRGYFAKNCFSGVIVYEHADSFDIVPCGIDKQTGLEALGAKLGVSGDEMIAVGDGVNDVPMFKCCKFSIGLDPLEKELTTFHFKNIKDALEHITEMIDNDK